MAFANRYDETVNTGTWVAGAAGLAASGLAVAFIAEGLLDSRLVMILCLSAMTGATISMALLWRWLAPSKQGFSLVQSALGGALSAVLSSIVMWPPVFFAIFEPGMAWSADLDGISAVIMGMVYFGFFALVFTGWITVPLGIVAAVLVTLWARSRIAAS